MENPTAAKVHAPPGGFLRRYVFSTDHKVIGIQYYLLALFSVFLGMTLSALMRYHLVYPGEKQHLFQLLWPNGAPDGIMTPELYLSLMTMHGTIMVFFVLTTAPQSGFGNYFLPLQIGAPDMAFPVLNMLSFWTTLLSFLVLCSAFFADGGAPLGGWTAYPPLSATGAIAGPGMGTGMDLWIISIALFCVASLMGAINFLTTVLEMRAKGMSLMRMPLTCWGWFVTAVISLFAFAVLLTAGILLLLDRLGGTSFFLPAGLVISDRVLDHSGGSPLLWQHLFWFFGHPEVYIAILPGMGLVSTVLSVFSRKPVFGYKAMAYAMVAIGLLGFLVWGHHMFISGMSPYSAIAFSVLTLAIGVPSAIKTFNWLGTIWGGQLRLTTAMLFALGFVSVFVSGGLTGLFLGQPALDLYFHDTYFVVGHFHMIMGVASIFGIFAATFYWFPKVTGRMMSEPLGKIHFYCTFLGAYAIFIPMHFAGIAGNPRRYADFTQFDFLKDLASVHKFITHAALFTAVIQLLFLWNLFWSWRRGAKARENPWNATTLEWALPSPPPAHNFGINPPLVKRGPYDYSLPQGGKDFLMQHEGEEE
ncbi:MAG: Alternative cytochrome c oxidase subunit 1 [Bryobacteraceae bacterium]|nr:Alternative cytochrome c oxidase subunit 1 [Bryobacteraceae bacterium]